MLTSSDRAAPGLHGEPGAAERDSSPRVDQRPRPLRALARTPQRWNAAMFVGVLVGFTLLAWSRRWMSDDGLIVLRTVRNLLAGHGLVFNIGERVEANTSTMWTLLLALSGLVPAVALEWASVVLGLVFAVGGLALGMDAARRLHSGFGGQSSGGQGSDGQLLVPAGALLVCALPPFRDFATSGLETGMVSAWLGGLWWLLVRRWQQEPAGAPWGFAVLLGLGPLVRPDLALASAVAFVAVLLLRWPGWRRTLLLGLAAGAAPAAYEVFRAGYYGLLVPSTAVAKEASESQWPQGLTYLGDLVSPYLLWLPLLLLGAGLLLATIRPAGTENMGPSARGVGRRAVVIAAPLVAGVLLGAYTVRVGGDFMHGRMLLPALFSVLLPVLVLPATRRTAAVLVGLAVWAVVAGGWLRPPYTDHPRVSHRIAVTGIADERSFYVGRLREHHPITAQDYRVAPFVRRALTSLSRAEGPAVHLPVGPRERALWFSYPAADPYHTVVFLNLGVMGELATPRVRVLDDVGLANPLAAHTERLPDGRIGHDKDLPRAWYVADSVRPGVRPYESARDLAAAYGALACPEIAEMLASVRAPLTAERFWQNLVGSVQRTSLRYPREPLEAAASCSTD